jgi:sulfide dehydrogenase cytochrome subunit
MRARGFLLALAALAPLAAYAQAAGPDAMRVRSMAATCAQCHGTDGRSAPGSALPSLAGMPREQIAGRLKAFKAGTQPATIMHQLSKGYSDAQIEQLAGFFAAQKP